MSDNRIFSAPHHRHSVYVHGSPNASPINVVLHLPNMCLFLQLFEAAFEPMKKWRPLWNWLGHLVSSSSIPNKEACTRDHPLTPPFVNPLHWILSGPYFNDKSTFPKEKQLCLSIRKLNNAMCIQYYPNPSLYVSRPYFNGNNICRKLIPLLWVIFWAQKSAFSHLSTGSLLQG